jgi:hypothetical protein
MDYLLWWQSNRKHLGIPSNLKHSITYLILYPHPTEDKDAVAFRKKNVVRTSAETVETKSFSSGISVEKVHMSTTEKPADPNYYQNLIFK